MIVIIWIFGFVIKIVVKFFFEHELNSAKNNIKLEVRNVLEWLLDLLYMSWIKKTHQIRPESMDSELKNPDLCSTIQAIVSPDFDNYRGYHLFEKGHWPEGYKSPMVPSLKNHGKTTNIMAKIIRVLRKSKSQLGWKNPIA